MSHSEAIKMIEGHLNFALPELQKVLSLVPYPSESYDKTMKALEAVAFASGLCKGFRDMVHYAETKTWPENDPKAIVTQYETHIGGQI